MMKLMVETTYHICGTYLINLTATGWGEVYPLTIYPRRMSSGKANVRQLSKNNVLQEKVLEFPEEPKQSQKKYEGWQKEAEKLFGLQKQVGTHGAPSDLASRIKNL